MPEPKTYTGGCHCGEVRFEVTADISNVVSCNCSICQKRGALWSFVPAGNFGLRAGGEDLRDYQFAKKTIHHLFCPRCGVGRGDIVSLIIDALHELRQCRPVCLSEESLVELAG